MYKRFYRWFPVFVLPTLAAFTIAFLIPFGMGIWLSFHRFTTVTNARFVGLENYVRAFLSALVPGSEYTGGFANADIRAGDVRLIIGQLEDGADFSLQVEPEPRMLFYNIQP